MCGQRLKHKIPGGSRAIGDLPTVDDQYLNAKSHIRQPFKTVEEFENIIVKSARDGSFIYLKDVARVELGAENYQSYSTTNGYPSAGLGISLACNCDVESDQAEIERLSSSCRKAKIAIRVTIHRLLKNRLSRKLYSRRSFWSSS